MLKVLNLLFALPRGALLSSVLSLATILPAVTVLGKVGGEGRGGETSVLSPGDSSCT